MPWMQTFMLMVTDRLRDDDGEVTIEYGILVVFVALALIAAAGALSDGIGVWFDRIAAFVSSRPAS